MHLPRHREFVTAILLGRAEAVGCQLPRLLPLERASLVQRVRRHAHMQDPIDRAEADGLEVWEANLPSRCGALAPGRIYVPPAMPDDEAEILIEHERTHHVAFERSLCHATEADIWIATAEAVWPFGHHRPIGPAHWFLDAISVRRGRIIAKEIAVA